MKNTGLFCQVNLVLLVFHDPSVDDWYICKASGQSVCRFYNNDTDIVFSDIFEHFVEGLALYFARSGLGNSKDFGDFQALFVGIVPQKLLLGW
jgi:hypothetical protein